MPIERYKDVSQMPRVPRSSKEKLVERINAAWEAAHLRGPYDIPRGVMKFKTIESAQQAREEFTKKRLRQLRKN